MKVTITLPVPMSFIADVEKQMADKKPYRIYKSHLISTDGGASRYRYDLVKIQRSAREEYHRYDWIEKPFWRVVISIVDNVDAIGAGLLVMAVKQAAAGCERIQVTSKKLSTQPVEEIYYGARHIVALEFEKGKTEIAELAEKIDAAVAQVSKETGHVFCDRIRRPFTPYLAVIRKGRSSRPALSTAFTRETAFDRPVGCVLNTIVVHISGRLANGEKYLSRTPVRLG